MKDNSVTFRKLVQGLERLPEILAPEVLALAQDYTPVRTGYLQSRWDVRVEPKAIVLSNDANYATFVEYGTARMEPRAMGRRAMAEIPRLMDKAIKEAFK